MTYEFPTDMRFRQVAAKLADAVQLAIWRGRKIKPLSAFPDRVPRPGCCCPMGALSLDPYPACGDQVDLSIKECEFLAFMVGFEAHLDKGFTSGEPDFSHLGRAYRERFR